MTEKKTCQSQSRERERERRRDRETHLKFLPGVSDAFNTYSHISGTLRQCNHGNRHQDYVKERHTKDPKMLCLKQWQRGPVRKEKTIKEKKKELKTEISKVPRKKARNTLRPARQDLQLLLSVCIVVLITLW